MKKMMCVLFASTTLIFVGQQAANGDILCDFITSQGEDCGPTGGGPGGLGADPEPPLRLWKWPSCLNPMFSMPCGPTATGWWEVTGAGGNIVVQSESCCRPGREYWRYIVLDNDGNIIGDGYDCFDSEQCS